MITGRPSVWVSEVRAKMSPKNNPAAPNSILEEVEFGARKRTTGHGVESRSGGTCSSVELETDGTPCDLELSFFLAAACFTMDRFFSSYRTVIFLATELFFLLAMGCLFLSDELLFVLATDFFSLTANFFSSHNSFVLLGKVS